MKKEFNKFWYRDIKPKDLGKEVIIIPSVPASFGQWAWHTGIRPEPGLYHNGIANKFIHTGERMFVAEYAAFKAPIKGMCLGSTRNILVSDFATDSLRAFCAKFDLKILEAGSTQGNSDINCFFAPLKGQPTEFTLSDFYDVPHIVESVENYLNRGKLARMFKIGRRIYENEEEYESWLRNEYVMFKNRTLKTIYIDDMPELRSDYQWNNGSQEGTLRRVGKEWKYDEPGELKQSQDQE